MAWQYPKEGDRIEARDGQGAVHRGTVILVDSISASFLILRRNGTYLALPYGTYWEKLKPLPPPPPPDIAKILKDNFCDICGCTYMPGTHVRTPGVCQKPRRDGQ